MKKSSHLRSRKTGLPPGSPMYVGRQNAQTTTISVIDYDINSCEIKVVASLEECFAEEGKLKVRWIDVSGLNDLKTITALTEKFGLHALVIEDIFNTQQRPKIDVFEDYIFLVMRSYVCIPGKKGFTSQQISFILGKDFVISIQESDNPMFALIKERLKTKQSALRKKGADYLLYALIDVIVDGYFQVVELIGNDMDEVEAKLSEAQNPNLVKEIHLVSKELIFLRKSIWPLREVVSSLQRQSGELITAETALYLRDVHDHTIQIIDTIETYRDFLGEMLDIHLSGVSNKLNEVMKVLTVFAAIFIPLTFVTSLYGMNFDTHSPFNMPELHWRYGYFFVLGIMAAMAIAMAIFFKRKKWW